MTEIQVYNSSDTPVGPIEYNGRAFIFPQDPTKKPGTYIFNGWEVDGGKIRRDGNGKKIARWLKVSDEAPASNVVFIPADMKNTLESGGVQTDFYITNLVIDRQIVNLLREEKIALEQAIARDRAEFYKAQEAAKAAFEAEKVKLLKEQDELKRAIAAERAALEAAKKAK
jgi:hypothetical protein